jgi:hypothetical protein
MELQVVGVRVGSEAVQQDAEASGLLFGDEFGGHGRGGGLEDAPDAEELQDRVVAVEVDDEAQRLRQPMRRRPSPHARNRPSGAEDGYGQAPRSGIGEKVTRVWFRSR